MPIGAARCKDQLTIGDAGTSAADGTAVAHSQPRTPQDIGDRERLGVLETIRRGNNGRAAPQAAFRLT